MSVYNMNYKRKDWEPKFYPQNFEALKEQVKNHKELYINKSELNKSM